MLLFNYPFKKNRSCVQFPEMFLFKNPKLLCLILHNERIISKVLRGQLSMEAGYSMFKINTKLQ